jgi:hypothetical protein
MAAAVLITVRTTSWSVTAKKNDAQEMSISQSLIFENGIFRIQYLFLVESSVEIIVLVK